MGKNEQKSASESLGDMLKELRNCVKKPCMELEYCPYGSLVEHFPLLAISGIIFQIVSEFLLRNSNDRGMLDSKTRWKIRWIFQQIIRKIYLDIFLNRYTSDEKSLKNTMEKRCSAYGHPCPVFFVCEPVREESPESCE